MADVRVSDVESPESAPAIPAPDHAAPVPDDAKADADMPAAANAPYNPKGLVPPPDGGNLKLVHLGLRGALFVFSLLTFSLIAGTKSNSTSVDSFAFALSMGVIAFVYAATLLVLPLIPATRDGMAQKQGFLAVLIADFVVLLLLFAAVCSAAADLSIFCDSTSIYILYGDCSLVTAGVSMGFFGAFSLLATFWLSLLGPLARI